MSKLIDTGASSWLFYFCILILVRYKNENINNTLYIVVIVIANIMCCAFVGLDNKL